MLESIPGRIDGGTGMGVSVARRLEEAPPPPLRSDPCRGTEGTPSTELIGDAEDRCMD